MLYNARMNAQGVPPPNLPLSSSDEDKPTGVGESSGVGATPKGDNKRDVPPVIPQASQVTGGSIETPSTPKQSPPVSQEITNNVPGGGLDAPDPFMATSKEKQDSKPSIGTAVGKKSTPKAADVAGISAPSISIGNPGGQASTAGSMGGKPIPPAAFRQPELPRKNKRKWAVIIGGVVILLLLVAIGFAVARFVMSNFGQSDEDVAEQSTDTEITEESIQQEETIDLMEFTEPAREDEQPTATGEATVSDNGSLDIDQDGLTADEERFYRTDENVADTDEDGYNDGDEVRAGFDPMGPGKLDSDNDGFADPDEKEFGTDPYNPDTDGDGYSDGDEMQNGYNPLIPSPGDKL